MTPTFFATPADFRAWLDAHHADATELLVGFWKKDSGKPSITWPEAVDEALCVGWIDGVRRRIDDEAYSIRFTPRRKGSTWSKVNIERVAVLTAQGRMRPSGLRAYEERIEANSGVYSYENRDNATLDAAFEEQLRSDAAAAAFFDAQPRWYRQAAIRWVMSAKREATRERRLAQLLSDSAAGRTVPPLSR